MPQEVPAGTPESVDESKIITPDGFQLRIRRWNSPRTDRWLVFVHGFGEHLGRYDHVIPSFLQSQWNVLAFDLRGHGESSGLRAHVRKFEEYCCDLQSVIRSTGLNPQRCALIGHSMGGLLALRSVQSGLVEPRCLVMMSPLLRLRARVPTIKRLVGRCLLPLWPSLRFRTTLSAEDASRIPEVVEERRADPLLQKTITAGTFFSLQSAMQAAWQPGHWPQPPTLILQAAEDRVVDPLAARDWMARMSQAAQFAQPSPNIQDRLHADIELQELADHFHEVFNEPEWPQTREYIQSWLNDRLPL